jgi:hypothetical protein
MESELKIENILNLDDFEISKFSPEEEMKNLSGILIDEKHSSVSSGLLCKICNNIVYEPVDCDQCMELMCKSCVVDSNKVSLANRKNSSQCLHSNFKNSCKTLKNMQNRISLKCPHTYLGCNEVMEYESLQSHLTKSCKFVKYKCNYCNYYGCEEECKTHSIECADSFITCSTCIEKIKKKNHKDHSSFDCLENICKIKILNYYSF